MPGRRSRPLFTAALCRGHRAPAPGPRPAAHGHYGPGVRAGRVTPILLAGISLHTGQSFFRRDEPWTQHCLSRTRAPALRSRHAPRCPTGPGGTHTTLECLFRARPGLRGAAFHHDPAHSVCTHGPDSAPFPTPVGRDTSGSPRAGFAPGTRPSAGTGAITRRRSWPPGARCAGNAAVRRQGSTAEGPALASADRWTTVALNPLVQ